MICGQIIFETLSDKWFFIFGRTFQALITQKRRQNLKNPGNMLEIRCIVDFWSFNQRRGKQRWMENTNTN